MDKFVKGALGVLVGLILIIALMSQCGKNKIKPAGEKLTPVTQAR